MGRKNSRPLESYSFKNRLADMAEAVDRIRRLQYQIRRFRTAQREPQKTLTKIKELLDRAATSAEQQLTGLRVAVECEDTIEADLDFEVISSALDEVVRNACRELQTRKVERPFVKFYATQRKGKIVIEIEDNGLPVDFEIPSNPFLENVTTYASTGQGTGLGYPITGGRGRD